jgi:hypothetical protein
MSPIVTYPTDIESFVQLLIKTKLNRKITKLAIDVWFSWRGYDYMTSVYASLMKMRLDELKKLYFVTTDLLTPGARGAKWTQRSYIIFGVLPLNSRTFWRRATQRITSEKAWSDAEPTKNRNIIFEHVGAWESAQVLHRSHGVWDVKDYAKAHRYLARGLSWKLSLEHVSANECCSKSTQEHD